jgi:hypothetical protein
MTVKLARLTSLLLLLVLGACAGSTDAPPVGSGGSSGPGTAGTMGAAGAAGNAGTAGAAGAAGTMDTAGTSGTVGTGGSTSGTAGTVGAGGATGAGGRGGTTGTGGAAGSVGGRGGNGGTAGGAGTSGGRGGTTGTAGAAGGRGGTTGTAGVTGGGGAGGCTITATSSVSTAIPTVGIVTFTTSLASIDSAEIRFGPAASGPTMTAPVSLTQPMYRTLLLGMKGSASYVYRIVATSSAGTCTSQDYTIMTGAVPSSVPKPTTTIMTAASHAKGFIVTSSGISGTGAWIYDSDGAPVWWSTGPSGTSRIQMSWDGSKMYMMALNVQNTSAGAVKIVDMDGNNATMASGMAASHHDMTAIPGGFATLLWNSSGVDAPCSLVERADSGTMKTVIANMNTVYNSSTFHTNSIHYYPSDDSYTLGDRNPNMYVKVTRAGALVWQLGGSNPKDMTKFFSGAGTWMVNHGHHMLPDGTFYLFNNGQGTGGSSTVRGFKLNTSSMTATSSFTYSGSGVSSMVMGDVQSLPNGNILVTASTSGQITELTTSMQVVATFKTTAFGYSEYRDSLYGPPPR